MTIEYWKLSLLTIMKLELSISKTNTDYYYKSSDSLYLASAVLDGLQASGLVVQGLLPQLSTEVTDNGIPELTEVYRNAVSVHVSFSWLTHRHRRRRVVGTPS